MAAHGWIVLLRLRKLAVQPLAKDLALLVGGVLEADTGLMAVAFPGQLARNFELLVHAGQFQREAERAFFGDAARKLKRHAAFAEVDGGGGVLALPGTLDRNFHWDPHLHPPFALHQGSNRAKTGLGALHRERLVQDEMRPHLETALESDGRLHQYDGESPLVDGSGFGSLQHTASFWIRRIYDDGFETLAGDPADGIVRGRAMLDANFQVAEDPAQDANRLFVRTE